MPTREERERPVGQGKGGDITAALDEAAERAVLTHFDRPDVRIVSEEIGIKGEGALTVVVDPIDGSQNAERGDPVLRALGRGRRGRRRWTTSSSASSTTSAPTRSGRRCAAAGAFLNGEPLTGRAEGPHRVPLARGDPGRRSCSTELAQARAAHRPGADHGRAGDHVLPSRRRPHRRRRLPEAVAVASTSPPAQLLVRERGFAIHAIDGPGSGRSRSTSTARSRICAAGTAGARRASIAAALRS